MHIDVPQLITNALGFLLLFWGLRRFAWGPILGMLETRREKIASDFAKAEAELARAEALRGDLDRQLKEVDATARKKIEEATTAGARVAGEIKEEARAEARKLLDKAKADIEHESAKARVQLRDDIVELSIRSAEKVLREKLDRDEQSRLVNKFIDELEGSNA